MVIKRPCFSDIKGHNDQDESNYADALEEYSTKLERYADGVERRCKELEYRNKWLMTTLDHYSVHSSAVYTGLKMAIKDARLDWEWFAEKRGRKDLFNQRIRTEPTYVEGVAAFYIDLGYKEEKKESIVITSTDGTTMQLDMEDEL